MAGWFKALTASLIDKGLNAVMHTRTKRQIVDTVLIMFCGLIGIGGLIFIAVGVYISLVGLYAPWLSGLIVGGVILALSVTGSLLLWLSMRRNTARKRKWARGSPSEQAQLDNVAYLGEIIGAHLSQRGIRTMDVMIAALAAGIALGARPALRARRRSRQGGYSGTSSADADRREPR